MAKKEKNNKKDDRNTKDRIIKIILIIIIILLLLRNCSLVKKKGKGDSNKVNIIDITSNDKCKPDSKMIDCLQDEDNSKCLVPNFIGKNKRDVLNWLNNISNTIETEIKTIEDENYKDGTVIEQSIIGTRVKDLLSGKTKLIVTIVNNGSLVDCKKNSKNSKCILPDFSSKKREDVEKWLDSIVNNVKIKYVYVDSNKKEGTIIKQSVKSGTAIKSILDNDETVIVYISNGGKNNFAPNPYTNGSNSEDSNPKESNTTPEPSEEPTEEPEQELDDEFYVSDNEIEKWNDETDIKIFEDSEKISKVNGKIAPESKGTYKFVINNGTQYNLKYKISFTENNQYNMNMKFKLKKGNTYLIDHYVSYEELNIDNMTINSHNSETYYLEWKWVGDNDTNDTSIGKNANNEDIYSLKINVEAESI